MLNKSLFLLLFTVFFIYGCANKTVTTSQAKTETLPAWIEQPVVDDDKYLYGLGIGKNREDAIKTALSDMVAKLGTTVESSFHSTQEVEGIYVKSITKNQIKSRVSKIKINNYKVIKSHKISYKEFAVMIKTDKQRFIDGLKANLKAKKQSMEQRVNSIEGSDTLTRYNIKKELRDDAQKLLSEVFILSELDKNFNKMEYLDFIDKRQKEFLQESKNLKFFIHSDKKSAKIGNVIKNYFAKNGFSVVNSKQDAIYIKIKTVNDVTKNSFINIAVLSFDISVFDKSHYIGGKSLVLKERYNGSYESVYKNAAIHLKQDIQAKGIDEVIGIDLR